MFSFLLPSYYYQTNGLFFVCSDFTGAGVEVCVDSHQNCSTWKELGYCQTYPMTMAEENCLQSCNWCPGKLHLPAQTGRLRNYSRRFSVTPGLPCSARCPHTSCKPLPVGAFLPSKQTRALRNYSCRFSLNSSFGIFGSLFTQSVRPRGLTFTWWGCCGLCL